MWTGFASRFAVVDAQAKTFLLYCSWTTTQKIFNTIDRYEYDLYACHEYRWMAWHHVEAGAAVAHAGNICHPIALHLIGTFIDALLWMAVTNAVAAF